MSTKIMTLKEVQTAIKVAKEPSWFHDKSSDFELEWLDISFHFDSIPELYQYISRQVRGWIKIKDLPNELKESKNNFLHILESLNTLLEKLESKESYVLENQWRQVKQSLQSRRAKYFTFELPVVSFLLDVYSKYPRCFYGAFEYVSKGTFSRYENADYFSGYMLAYEFTMNADDSILKRVNKEKPSISRLRNEFETHFKNTQNFLNESIEELSEKVESTKEDFEQMKDESKVSYDQWYEVSQSEWQKFKVDAANERAELERVYRELLQMKEPVKYWEERTEQLLKQGWRATYGLISLVIFGATSLFTLLWLAPEGLLLSFFDDKVLAIRWSIIFVTFLSFLAYGIRILSRISFSSFHLASDAKERRQLTYLYLALNKEGDVDKSDRQIVLQSLFSRADTGLLRDDASPTMPGIKSVLEKQSE